MKKVIFRADGNQETGLGHVIRSCAVAGMISGEFDCSFFIQQPSEYLKCEIVKSGCKLIELPVSENYEQEAEDIVQMLTGTEIVVLDGYNFKTIYQKILKDHGCSLICIDDIHACFFVADAVINHAGGITPADYASDTTTQFFMGVKYSLLRKEFFQDKIEKRETEEILICLGGSDPNNDVISVIQKVTDAGFSKLHILTGSGYRYDAELQSLLAKLPVHAKVYKSIEAVEVATLMKSCRYAVLSPSGVCYEFMNITGVVYLHQIADNQNRIKRFLLQHNLAFDFSDFGTKTKEEEMCLIQNQKSYFDRKYPSRIRNIFYNISLFQDVNIRRAILQDVDLTFTWANDKLARAMSFNSAPIAPEQHAAWFHNKIVDAQSFYYLFKISEEPFAQIRFDYKQDTTEYVLSYFISEPFRRRGLGSSIIIMGLQQFQIDLSHDGVTIVGYVKKDNIASCVSFEKTKFLKCEATDFPDSYKYTMTF